MRTIFPGWIAVVRLNWADNLIHSLKIISGIMKLSGVMDSSLTFVFSLQCPSLCLVEWLSETPMFYSVQLWGYVGLKKEVQYPW